IYEVLELAERGQTQFPTKLVEAGNAAFAVAQNIHCCQVDAAVCRRARSLQVSQKIWKVPERQLAKGGNAKRQRPRVDADSPHGFARAAFLRVGNRDHVAFVRRIMRTPKVRRAVAAGTMELKSWQL